MYKRQTYVYQAMRVTGAADPTVSVKDTMKGKLPQKKLVREAAHGYSSYGNQIGLATGAVKEIYHPNYVAKRMEIGAVLGAAPRRAVIRETSDPGDIIILLGGRTGRDGCGGATGSSKVHTEESIEAVSYTHLAFNRFYHETKILSEEDETKKKSYLALLTLTKEVLEECIDMLGFKAPERM